MSSLKHRIALLETDLGANPPRISVYHDLPFAILRYDPEEEWELRRQVRLLATRLSKAGKQVHCMAMSEFLWKAIDESEGIDDDGNELVLHPLHADWPCPDVYAGGMGNLLVAKARLGRVRRHFGIRAHDRGHGSLRQFT